MAIGISRLLGIKLKMNFKYPFFARNIAEFWNRWHISLTTWIRDYLYFALRPQKKTKWTKFKVVFWIFVISGFWHGAEWTFILWGVLHALCFIPIIFGKGVKSYKGVVAQNSILPTFLELKNMILTFSFIVITIIFFRAENISHVIDCYQRIFSPSILSLPFYPERRESVVILLLIIGFLLVEWRGRKEDSPLFVLFNKAPRIARWMFYILLIMIICISQNQERSFIYFQF